LVRPLVALFLLAQLAGVVSSPRANAQPIPNAFASHILHQHAHQPGDEGKSGHQGDKSGTLGDHCCALHAFFSGVLPPDVAIEPLSNAGQRLSADARDRGISIAPDRLDRPPRPLR
jgi:hypothetical protein